MEKETEEDSDPVLKRTREILGGVISVVEVGLGVVETVSVVVALVVPAALVAERV